MSIPIERLHLDELRLVNAKLRKALAARSRTLDDDNQAAWEQILTLSKYLPEPEIKHFVSANGCLKG